MFKKLTEANGLKIVVNTDHVIMARQIKTPSAAKTEITINLTGAELVGTSGGATNEFMPMTLHVIDDIDQIFP